MASPHQDAENDLTTTLGARPVATRTAQTVELGAAYLVVVVARDRSGSPLADAPVTVFVDDLPLPVRVTDAAGLVEPPFRVVPSKNICVSADFPPAPDDAEPPKHGGLMTLPDAVVLDVAALDERGHAPVKDGFEPAWPDLGPAKKVVFLTLRPRCQYWQKRHFPWQNPILRDLVYRKDPQEHNDPGQRTQTGELVVAPDRDRKQRLRDVVVRFAAHTPGAKSLSAFWASRKGRSRPTPELDAIERMKLEQDLLFAALGRVERRIEWLMVYAYPRKGAKPPDPALSPPAPEDPLDERHEREEPEGVADASEDVGAGQRKQDLGDPPPAYVDPAWRDIDVSTPKKEVESLKARRTQMLKRAKALNADPAAIADAELRALTHRELVEYIVYEIFGNDPKRERFPGWIRYAILHFSGLRYAGAHGSYYPAEEIVGALRDREIAAERGAPLDRHRLAIFLSEHASLLRADGALRAVLLSKSERVAYDKGNPLAMTGVAGQLFAATATVRGEAEGKAVLGDAAVRDALHVAVVAFAEHWIRRMNDEAARRAALSPAVGDDVPPFPPLADAHGLLVRARDTGKLPADAWPAVVQFTELRNDFVNVPEVAFRPPPKKAKKTDPDPVVPPPPPPVDGSQWPVLAPPLDGSAFRLYGPQFPDLFQDGHALRWKSQQAGDLSLVVSRAVCNQITEMLAAARGLRLKGGIRGDATSVDSAAEQLAQILPKPKRAPSEAATEPEADTFATAFLDAARLTGVVNSLSLGSSASQVRRGDFMFFMVWRQIGTKDPSGWVSPFLHVPRFKLEVRSPSAPRPRTKEELEADSADFHARTKAWKERRAAWGKKVESARATRRKAERLARDLAARMGQKYVPPKPPPGGDYPGEEPFTEQPPARPQGPPGLVLTVQCAGKKPPVFLVDNRPLLVIEDWDDPRVVKGAAPRPPAVTVEYSAALPGDSASPASQLALLRTPLEGDLAYVFVRRHPRAQVYTEVLGWEHIATVIEPPGEHGRIITFETNAPTGVNVRSWPSKDSDNWPIIFGHMTAQDEALPYLEPYLDPALLLDENALSPQEDR